MSTDEREKIARAKKFSELSQTEQIEKLRHELQIAFRSLARYGEMTMKQEQHEHGQNGRPMIPSGECHLVYGTDRSSFLD